MITARGHCILWDLSIVSLNSLSYIPWGSFISLNSRSFVISLSSFSSSVSSKFPFPVVAHWIPLAVLLPNIPPFPNSYGQMWSTDNIHSRNLCGQENLLSLVSMRLDCITSQFLLLGSCLILAFSCRSLWPPTLHWSLVFLIPPVLPHIHLLSYVISFMPKPPFISCAEKFRLFCFSLCNCPLSFSCFHIYRHR